MVAIKAATVGGRTHYPHAKVFYLGICLKHDSQHPIQGGYKRFLFFVEADPEADRNCANHIILQKHYTPCKYVRRQHIINTAYIADRQTISLL